MYGFIMFNNIISPKWIILTLNYGTKYKFVWFIILFKYDFYFTSMALILKAKTIDVNYITNCFHWHFIIII